MSMLDDLYRTVKLVRRHIVKGGVDISYGGSLWVRVGATNSGGDGAAESFMLSPRVDKSRCIGIEEERAGSEAALVLALMKALERFCTDEEIELVFAPYRRWRKLGYRSPGEREMAIWKLIKRLEPEFQALGLHFGDEEI